MCKNTIWLPITGATIFGLGIVGCYFIGLSSGDYAAVPYWPYVSDTGAKPKESCVFALIFNWCAVIFMFCTISYYKYVAQHGHQCRLNQIALGFSITAAAGLSLVGCFQYTEMIIPHSIGAVLAFLGGNIYCWMIVVLNAAYLPRNLAGKTIVAIRATTAALQSIALLIFAVLVCMSEISDTLFTVMTSCEWAGTYLLLIYMLTFTYEFNKINKFHFHIGASNLIEEIQSNTFPDTRLNIETSFTKYG